MDQHENVEILSALLDGALSRDEEARAASHVAVCPDCRALQAGLKGVRDRLRAAPRRPMPAGLAADIQRLADRGGAPVWRLPRIPWRPLLIPTLGFATAAVFAGLWAWERAIDQQPQIPIQALLAAHERYRDEGLLASVDPAQADFPSTLGSYENDTDL